jgi:hypothetical protein
VVELAVAGNATHLVMNNIRDFRQQDLRFDDFKVITPEALLRDLTT